MTDQAVTGIYLLLSSTGQFYVGQSVDIERRIGEHAEAEKFVKAIFKPFYVNSGIDKTELRNLEQYVLDVAEDTYDSKGVNKIRPRSASKYIKPCE